MPSFQPMQKLCRIRPSTLPTPYFDPRNPRQNIMEPRRPLQSLTRDTYEPIIPSPLHAIWQT